MLSLGGGGLKRLLQLLSRVSTASLAFFGPEGSGCNCAASCWLVTVFLICSPMVHKAVAKITFLTRRSIRGSRLVLLSFTIRA